MKFLIYLGFNNLLTEPTRITESSSTLTDLIYTSYVDRARARVTGLPVPESLILASAIIALFTKFLELLIFMHHSDLDALERSRRTRTNKAPWIKKIKKIEESYA